VLYLGHAIKGPIFLPLDAKLSAVYAVVVCLCVCVCACACHTPVLYHKKLCYGRQTRDALVSIEKRLQSMNNLDIHPRSSQLLLLNGRIAYHFLFVDCCFDVFN